LTGSEVTTEPEAQVVVFGAPPVDGLGSTGGFKMQVQDRGDLGLSALQGAVENMAQTGNQQPGLVGLFSSFSTNQPQLYVEVDRVKAKAQGVALSDVFDTLQAYGVVPLVVSKGAGAEMRQALGIAVFSGMIGVRFSASSSRRCSTSSSAGLLGVGKS
jgi:multidrug efflux pump subunit AcrB